MERRKQIYEKIKDTKLNKLTVKQGDANVVLNLKVDLLDPKVDIGEKVLLMLENFAIQQQQQSGSSAPKVAETPTPTPTPLVLPSSSILSNISKSPTKSHAKPTASQQQESSTIENIRKTPTKSPAKSPSTENIKDPDLLKPSKSKASKSSSNENLNVSKQHCLLYTSRRG